MSEFLNWPPEAVNAQIVLSSDGKRTYLVGIDLETGTAICDCPWATYHPDMRIDKPKSLCKHVRGLLYKMMEP